MPLHSSHPSQDHKFYTLFYIYKIDKVINIKKSDVKVVVKDVKVVSTTIYIAPSIQPSKFVSF